MKKKPEAALGEAVVQVAEMTGLSPDTVLLMQLANYHLESSTCH